MRKCAARAQGSARAARRGQEDCARASRHRHESHGAGARRSIRFGGGSRTALLAGEVLGEIDRRRRVRLRPVERPARRHREPLERDLHPLELRIDATRLAGDFEGDGRSAIGALARLQGAARASLFAGGDGDERQRERRDDGNERRAALSAHRADELPERAVRQGSHGVAAKEPAHVVGERRHRSVSIGGLQRRGFHDDGAKLARNLLAPAERLERCLVPAPRTLEGHDERGGVDGAAQRNDLEEHEAQRVLVRKLVELAIAPGGLFGRHVARSTEDSAGERQIPFGGCGAGGQLVLVGDTDLFRDAPVHQVDLAEAADHDVRRLQVPVDDALVVGEREGLAELEEDLQARGERLVLRQGLAPLGEGACIAKERAQRTPFDELHDVADRVAIASGLEQVDRHHVRVLELRRQAGLAKEALSRHRVLLVEEPLDRHRAREIDLLAANHDRHAPAADLLHEAEPRGRCTRPRYVAGGARVPVAARVRFRVLARVRAGPSGVVVHSAEPMLSEEVEQAGANRAPTASSNRARYSARMVARPDLAFRGGPSQRTARRRFPARAAPPRGLARYRSCGPGKC